MVGKKKKTYSKQSGPVSIIVNTIKEGIEKGSWDKKGVVRTVLADSRQKISSHRHLLEYRCVLNLKSDFAKWCVLSQIILWKAQGIS